MIERGLRGIAGARNEVSRERAVERLRTEANDQMQLANTLLLKYNEITPASCQRVFRPFAVKRELTTLDERIDSLTAIPVPDARERKQETPAQRFLRRFFFGEV